MSSSRFVIVSVFGSPPSHGLGEVGTSNTLSGFQSHSLSIRAEPVINQLTTGPAS
mgnify:FL=1